jgi:hypothetical protein
MKNFGSILTLLAISASVVSARALPSEDGLEARAPLAIGKRLVNIWELPLTYISVRNFRSFTKEG